MGTFLAWMLLPPLPIKWLYEYCSLQRAHSSHQGPLRKLTTHRETQHSQKKKNPFSNQTNQNFQKLSKKTFQVDSDTNFSSLSVLFPIIPSLHPTASIHQLSDRRAGLGGDGQTDGWKARGRRQGMDGRKEERERCDPHSRAWSIYRRKCPNWQAAGRATALHWYPTPCPSPPQPRLLLVFRLLLPPCPPVLFHLPECVFPRTLPLHRSFCCLSLLLFHVRDLLSVLRLPPLTPSPLLSLSTYTLLSLVSHLQL